MYTYLTKEWEANIFWSLFTLVGSIAILLIFKSEIQTQNQITIPLFVLSTVSLGMVMGYLFAALDQWRGKYAMSQLEYGVLGIAGKFVKYGIIWIPAVWVGDKTYFGLNYSPWEPYLILWLAAVLYFVVLNFHNLPQWVAGIGWIFIYPFSRKAANSILEVGKKNAAKKGDNRYGYQTVWTAPEKVQ